VVLDQGQVIEMGRHDELMARQGTYAKMVERQQQRFPGRDATLSDWPLPKLSPRC
jgi:ABC-type transport system involved in cytochrome bd biosynthesis fused ATPase/permease subunit